MARFRVRRGHLGGCVFPRVRDGRRARRAVRAAGRPEGEEEDVRGGGGARESRGEAALEADAAFVQERHGAPRVPGDVVRVDGGQLPPTQERDSGRRDGSRENRAVHLGDGARADDASARAAPVPGDRAAHHPRPLEARDGVEALLLQGLKENPSAASAIGYRETIAFLDGELKHDELLPSIVQNTLHLVKKQSTWFRTQIRRPDETVSF